MKPELIKKLVELAEGFEMEGHNAISLNNGLWIRKIEAVESWEHFPLLIHRGKDGWNRTKPELYINIFMKFVSTVKESGTQKIWTYQDYKPTDTLTVEEVCTMKALEEVFK